MKILNGEAQMKKFLTVTMHVLGAVAVAIVLFAMMAAPGFLSGASSVIQLSPAAQVSSR